MPLDESRAGELDRIVVVGTSGAGKTTFARALSRRLDLPHTELDVLYWGPDWTPVAPATFRARVEAAVHEPAWVIDGNYSDVRDLVWGRATALVWLDYAFFLVFPRACWRTFKRIVTGELLFAGNRESFEILDRDWIPWWVLRTFWKRRREYPGLLDAPAFSHLDVRRFRSPRDAERFLDALPARRRPGDTGV